MLVFSYLRYGVCSFCSGAGKFCVAHGLGQLTRDIKSDVRTLNFRIDVTFAPPRKTPNGVRRRSLCDMKSKKYKKLRMMDNNFIVIGKKKKHRSPLSYLQVNG